MNENEINIDEVVEQVTDTTQDSGSQEETATVTGKASIETDPPPENELESLRAEVNALRTRLDEERAVYSRMNEECAEFVRLYPTVPISSLSDSIWDSVKRGVPIAAAYALEERRAAVTDTRAHQINDTNRRLSSGSVDSPGTEEFFSPAEVKAMSPAEVRANYSKIISSMSKWH